MSSSTSSSEHARFLLWVVLAFVASGVVLHLLPWSGPERYRRSHERAAASVGADTDFLLVGDSKVSPFSQDCLLTGTQPWHGLAFTANSVTPIFHYDALRAMAAADPAFAPRVVFIAIGANNFNTNGLHMQREYTLNNLLDFDTLWDLTAAQGEWLSLAEALLSRIVPIYGKRVQITHLQVERGSGHDSCAGLTPESWDDPRYAKWRLGRRSPITDRNYLEIYRRSLYHDYEHSRVAERALRRLIELVRGWGGVPILVELPVSPEMNALSAELVGDAFMAPIRALGAELDVQILDLSKATQYDFNDVNHLSQIGARDLSRDHFAPIVERLVAQATAHD